MIQKFPRTPGWIVPASLILSVLSICALIFHLFKIQSLERQLVQERKAAEAGFAELDAINRELARELDLLHDQASLTQRRMAELERLEREVRRWAGRARLVATLAGDAVTGGAGGLYVAYSQDSPGNAEQVRAKFDTLLRHAERLSASYRQAISDVSDLDGQLRRTPILWPTDSRQINSDYGYRRDPFTGRAAQHNGLDIDGKTGDPVYAAADGIVVEAGWNGPHGRQVIIEHNERYTTVYSHLGKWLVESGQFVHQGDLIGEIGSSGRSTGPHLHYEILLDGEQVDPRDYLLADRDPGTGSETQPDDASAD